MYCIYKLTSKTSGKIYIGMTNNFQHRMNQHKYSTKKYHINMAIKSYGFDDFQQEILIDNLEKEDAALIEILLIAQYRSTNPLYGYNINIGGDINIDPRTGRGYGYDTTKFGISSSDNIKLYRKRYYTANKPKIKEHYTKYRKENHDIVLQSKKEYRANNKDKIKLYKHQYYERNKELVKQKDKEYRLKHRSADLERKRLYRLKNKDKIAEYNLKRKEFNNLKKDLLKLLEFVNVV